MNSDAVHSVSGSWAMAHIRELHARLRFAADALGVPVGEIRLDDLSPFEAQRLRVLGQADLWAALHDE